MHIIHGLLLITLTGCGEERQTRLESATNTTSVPTTILPITSADISTSMEAATDPSTTTAETTSTTFQTATTEIITSPEVTSYLSTIPAGTTITPSQTTPTDMTTGPEVTTYPSTTSAESNTTAIPTSLAETTEASTEPSTTAAETTDTTTDITTSPEVTAELSTISVEITSTPLPIATTETTETSTEPSTAAAEITDTTSEITTSPGVSTTSAETTSTALPTSSAETTETSTEPATTPVMQRMETQSVVLFSQRLHSYSSALDALNGAIPHDTWCPGRSFTVNRGKPFSVFHKVQTSKVHSNGAVFYADGSNKYLKKIAHSSKEKLLELARDSAALEVLSDTGAVPMKIAVTFERGTSQICHLMTLVMENAGRQSLKSFRGQPLGKELVSAIGTAAINLLEKVHARGLVHGDVHQGNFVLNPSNPADSLRILDFGNARPYIDQITGFHVPQTGADPHNTQNPVYMSVFELEGSAVSRRDDLFRLAELVIFLVSGNDYIANAQTADELIEKKRNRRFDINRVPIGFYKFYKKTMELGFDQTPNYEEYRTLLRKLELQKPNRSN